MFARLFRLVLTMCVIAILSVGFYWWQFVYDQSWTKVMAESLEDRVNMELQQIYWSWQQQGRPETLRYAVNENAPAVVILMQAQGTPFLKASKEDCRQLFLAIVDDAEIKKNLSVSLMKEDEDAARKTGWQCRYQLFDKHFIYHVETAEFEYLR